MQTYKEAKRKAKVDFSMRLEKDNDQSWDKYVSALPVYVVNLDKHKEKYDKVASQFLYEGVTNIQRISAVDASKEGMASHLQNESTILCGLMCTPPMIAIYLSHKKIWEKIVQERTPLSIICEDDAVIVHPNQFKTKLRNILSHTPSDFDILLLGCFLCKAEKNDSFSKFLIGIQSYGRSESFVNEYITKPSSWAGTHGYCVTYEGAKHLLQSYQKAVFHVDVMMRSLPQLVVYASKDPLINQNLSGNETSNVTASFGHYNNELGDYYIDHGNMSMKFALNMSLAQICGITITAYRLILFVATLCVVLLLLRFYKSLDRNTLYYT